MYSTPILLTLLPATLALKPVIDFGGPAALTSDGPIILPEGTTPPLQATTPTQETSLIAAETTTSNSIITSINPGGGISISTSGSTTSPTAGTTITSVQPGGGISVSTQVTSTPDTSSPTGVSSFQPGGPVISTSSSHLSLGPGPVLNNSTMFTVSSTNTAAGATGTTGTGSMTTTGTATAAGGTATSGAVAARMDVGVMGALAFVVGAVLM